MKDWLYLAESPIEEECAQVGSKDYYERAMKELKELKRMMTEIHPPICGTWYQIKSEPHDFGTHYSLFAVILNDENPEQQDWMYDAEDKIPEHWDDTAIENLTGYISVDKLQGQLWRLTTIQK